jgi:hypothetical protein
VNEYDWHKKLHEGARGLRQVVRWLHSLGYGIMDVSEHPSYQKLDIDLLVDGLTVEVKTDLKAKRNLYLEFAALAKSRADVWLYYLPQLYNGTIIAFSKSELDLWLREYGDEFEPKAVRTGRGSRTWEASGIAVPMKRLFTDLAVNIWTGVESCQAPINNLARPLSLVS